MIMMQFIACRCGFDGVITISLVIYASNYPFSFDPMTLLFGVSSDTLSQNAVSG